MNRSQAKQLIPVIAGTLVAMLPMETTPFLISGAVKAGHLGIEAAGWIGTASIAAVAAASMAIAPVLGRISLRATVISLGLVAAVSYLLMAVAASFALFMVLAVLAGSACGGLLGCMAMIVAGTPDPDRSYGVIYAATGVVFATLLFALPAVGEAFSAAMMFVLIAVLAFAALPVAARVVGRTEVHHGEDAGAAGPINWVWVGLLVLIMTVAFPLYGGVYGFAERKAVEVGLSSVQAGMVISAGTILTILGTLCVAAIGTRFGRLKPTVAVMTLATAAYGLTLGAARPSEFVIGFLLFGFMQLALNSYFFGLASALDRGGKVAASLQGFSLVPYALGTGIFGSLTEGGPLTPLAAPAVTVNIIATLMLLPILVSLDRRRSGRVRPIQVAAD